MNINKLKENDFLHVYYSYQDSADPYDDDYTVNVRFSGLFSRIENKILKLANGESITQIEIYDKIETKSFDECSIPIKIIDTILCEQIMIEDISVLVTL